MEDSKMYFLIGRTLGIIILSIIVTFMWGNHKRKGTSFIKKEVVSQSQKEKRIKLEKRLDIVCIVGLVIVWVFLTLPCLLDMPYLVSGNLKNIEGMVVSGDVAGEDSKSDRLIQIEDEKLNEKVYLNYYGEGVSKGARIKARYLPHTEYGYIIEKEEKNE